MHCNFICGLSDVIIKTFSQSVDTLEPRKPWVLMHRVGATRRGLQSPIWTGRNGTAVQFSLVWRLWTLLNGFFAVHELNWGLLFWTRVCVSNGSVFTAHELADVRLVSLQPINRDADARDQCTRRVTGSTCCGSVQFSSVHALWTNLKTTAEIGVAQSNRGHWWVALERIIERLHRTKLNSTKPNSTELKLQWHELPCDYRLLHSVENVKWNLTSSFHSIDS